MKHNRWYPIFALILVAAFVLTACQTATQAPVAQPTKPAETAAPAFTAQKLEVADCKYGGNLRSIVAPDQFTVAFTFCTPEPAFLPKVSLASFGIYDSDALKAAGGDAAKINDKPIGTGPYVVKEWVRGDHITLEANPNYWGTPPVTKTLIFRWSKEAAQRLLELQSGNTMGIDNPGTDDIPAIEKNAALKNYLRPTPNLLYLGIQRDTPPWNNESVRQALAMLLNRQSIVDNFYPKGSMVAQQFVPPTLKPGYTEGFKYYDLDIAKAKQMLTDAKFDFTKEYELYYADRTRPYFPQPVKIATDIQAQLKAVGINIKLIQQEWAAYLPNVREGKAPLHLLGWGEDYPDGTDWYDVFMLGTNAQFGKPFEDIVVQIKIAATSSDPVVRQKAYDEVNKLYKLHVPSIPIAHSAQFETFDAKVGGVKIGPYNENFEEMTGIGGKLIFSQGGEPNSLDCVDETDGDSFRVCDQIFNHLYDFTYGAGTVEPSLAEKCTANADLTVWTCTMRKDVKFSNGAAFDAMDVFTSFTASWDAANPLHKGRVGDFQYFLDFFGGQINKPAAK